MNSFARAQGPPGGAKVNGDGVDFASRVVLIVGADSNSTWNRRKELLESRLNDPQMKRSRRAARHRSRRGAPRMMAVVNNNDNTGRRSSVDPLLAILASELAFCALVLTKHPKSAETWSHRGWLLRMLLADLQQQQQARSRSTPRGNSNIRSTTTRATTMAHCVAHQQMLVRELVVCQRAAEQHPRCYYAWVHRGQVSE